MIRTVGIPYRSFPEIPLGPVDVRVYGLAVAIGVLVGAWLMTRSNLRHGIPADVSRHLVIMLVAGGLVGACLAWVLPNLDRIDSPLDVVAVWDGGLTLSGGFLAAAVTIPYLTRRPSSQGRSRSPPWRRASRWSGPRRSTSAEGGTGASGTAGRRAPCPPARPPTRGWPWPLDLPDGWQDVDPWIGLDPGRLADGFPLHRACPAWLAEHRPLIRLVRSQFWGWFICQPAACLGWGGVNALPTDRMQGL
jgi:hypothetical protein